MTNLEQITVLAAESEAAEQEQETVLEASQDGSGAFLAKGFSQVAGDGAGHDQIMEMCSRVDLLALVRQDTGEAGKVSGNRVDFHTCPICGNHDDFSVYTDTNSFSCFAEDMAEHRKPGALSFGGNVCDYLRFARHDGDNVAAITELHELSGVPYVRKDGAGGNDADSASNASTEESDGDGFPPITQSKAVNPPARSPALIEGILRRGHILLVTARSKAGKTFLMLELAIAIACGLEWLGKRCQQGRVLFVNPEVDPPSAENRLHDVAEAMRADLDTVRQNVDFWHLRGHAQGIDDTARALFARVKRGDYALIILDSVYELYSGDENSADDAREFFHGIDRISKQLGCSVAMTHHHAKGIRADFDALDRGSGSGVFGRKPDAPLDLIQVFPPSDDDSALDEGVTVWRVSDSGLREFPSMKAFDVFFKYPRHLLVPDGMTDAWKPRSRQQDGGRQTGEGNKQKKADRARRCELAIAAEFIANGYGSDGISGSEAAEIASDAMGETVKAQTLKNYIEASEVFCVEQVSSNRWRCVPRRVAEPPHLE